MKLTTSPLPALTWPLQRNLAVSVASTARSTSADLKTMNGAFPPSSRLTFFTVDAARSSKIYGMVALPDSVAIDLQRYFTHHNVTFVILLETSKRVEPRYVQTNATNTDIMSINT